MFPYKLGGLGVMVKDFVISDLIETHAEGMITILGLQDRPGVASKLFGQLSKVQIPIHTIIQNSPDAGTTNITFTVARLDFEIAMEICREFLSDQAEGLIPDPEIARVSIIGSNLEDSAGLASTMFELMAKYEINILAINATHDAISILIKEEDRLQAIKVLTAGFIIENPETAD
jgi:aspartate kinase